MGDYRPHARLSRDDLGDIVGKGMGGGLDGLQVRSGAGVGRGMRLDSSSCGAVARGLRRMRGRMGWVIGANPLLSRTRSRRARPVGCFPTSNRSANLVLCLPWSVGRGRTINQIILIYLQSEKEDSPKSPARAAGSAKPILLQDIHLFINIIRHKHILRVRRH